MEWINVHTLYSQIRIKHSQHPHEIFTSPGEVRTDSAAFLWHADPGCPGQTPSIPLVSTALLQHNSDHKAPPEARCCSCHDNGHCRYVVR